MFEVPANIVTDISSSVANTIDNLWSIIILMVSIPLAFYILRKILAMFPKR